jgi:hypothetical protein
MKSTLMRWLQAATVPVLLLLGGYCFVWAFAVGPFGDDLCGDEGAAVRVVGGGLGLLLIAEAVLSVSPLLSKNQPGRIGKLKGWGTAVGVVLFAGWALWAIVVSVSCTT